MSDGSKLHRGLILAGAAAAAIIALWPSAGAPAAPALAYLGQPAQQQTAQAGATFSRPVRVIIPPDPGTAIPATYTVLPGDNGLSVIAQKLWGHSSDWPVLYYANGNTTIISAGEVLKVPPLPAVIPPLPATATTSSSPAPTGTQGSTPGPSSAPSPGPTPTGSSIWYCIVQYEASPPGNWATDTGNGYYGGLQFTEGTWLGFGGGAFAQYADDATPADQITVANRVAFTGWNGNAPQGLGAWPQSSAKCGA